MGVSGRGVATGVATAQRAALGDGACLASGRIVEITLLTGGQDRHYAFGLATSLAAKDVRIEVIGNEFVDGPEMHSTHGLRFLDLYGSQRPANILVKIKRIARFYIRLIQYAINARPRIFHILWNDKLQFFDRTLLMLCYKLLGKKVVITVHNVNAGRRDLSDSFINRFTLKFQYRRANHLFVHTVKMKGELVQSFQVNESSVTIIPYGINNALPTSDLTSEEARHRLGIGQNEKTILFFGAIKQYKGLEYLVAAFQKVAAKHENFRLIIAGERKRGYEDYFDRIRSAIDLDPSRSQIIQQIGFIPDNEAEVYFKSADVVVLPYTEIFQSGILFMAYSFGLPVIATDVGSFAEDIVEGQTGFVCKARDAGDLTAKILHYFGSDLYRTLKDRRQEIQDFALARHSWEEVAALTREVYRSLLSGDFQQPVGYRPN